MNESFEEIILGRTISKVCLLNFTKPYESMTNVFGNPISREPNPFDWYGRFGHFKIELTRFLKRGDNVLVIGCGNSRLTEELYASEYTSIANIDFSDTVIKQMQERHQEKTTLTWDVMDVTENLTFPAESFDVCIDKGCLDSILCGDSSTNKIANALYHIIRVLKSNGTFLLITHWPPEKWLGYLEVEMYNWAISVFAVPRPVVGMPPETATSRDTQQTVYGDPVAVHYLYVCKKLEKRG